MSQILIKYSLVTETPVSLVKGELAYSQLSGNLYIGSDSGVPQLIGGADLVAKFGVVDGAVTQLKIDVDAAEVEIQTLINSVLGAGGVVERLVSLETARDDHESRITDNTGRINGVESAYLAADAVLGVRIDGVSAEIANLQTQVGTGLTDRVKTLEDSQLVQDGLITDVIAESAAATALLNGGKPTFSDLTVTGKLIVNGGVTSIESTVVTIKDPVISLGDATALVNDGMDRGVEFKHFDSNAGAIKTGFFGMDGVDKKFRFIPDAEMNSGDNVYTGDTGIIVGNIEGTATKLAAEFEFKVSGDAIGQVNVDGGSNVNMSVAVTGYSDAIADGLVRRDGAGNAKFAIIETFGQSIFGGGADFKGKELVDAVINGGEF
jgi:hypothetical protein